MARADYLRDVEPEDDSPAYPEGYVDFALPDDETEIIAIRADRELALALGRG